LAWLTPDASVTTHAPEGVQMPPSHVAAEQAAQLFDARSHVLGKEQFWQAPPAPHTDPPFETTAHWLSAPQHDPVGQSAPVAQPHVKLGRHAAPVAVVQVEQRVPGCPHAAAVPPLAHTPLGDKEQHAPLQGCVAAHCAVQACVDVSQLSPVGQSAATLHPASSLDAAQLPPLQTGVDPPHAFPHAPQLAALVASSTQRKGGAPPAAWPHAISPPQQLATEQSLPPGDV
jgi:hypothetical protein